MNQDEKEGWMAFRQVVSNFVSNTTSPNYKELVKNLLCACQKLVCNVSVKVHFLHSPLDYFHQDIKTMEKRYQSRWNVNI